MVPVLATRGALSFQSRLVCETSERGFSVECNSQRDDAKLAVSQASTGFAAQLATGCSRSYPAGRLDIPSTFLDEFVSTDQSPRIRVHS